MNLIKYRHGILRYLTISLVCASHSLSALETLVVSGSRFESPAYTIPGKVTVINADEIAISGADHIVDVLRTTGGLQVTDLFGDGTDVSIGLRGFSATAAQNTLILIDGRRLNNVDNSLPDLNAISLKNIDKIEIVKGSMGSLYGDKAVGGIINIITRKPDGLQLLTEARYGSYNNRSLFASAENYHENGINYRLSAYRQLSDNYRENNDLRLTNITSRAAYTYTNGEIFIEFQDVSEAIQLPGALFRDLFEEDRRQALNAGDHINTETWAGRLGIRQGLLEWLEVEAEYTNRFNDIQGQLSSAGSPEDFISKRHHIEFTPRLIASVPFNSREIQFSLGLDWFNTDYLIVSDFGITDDTQSQLGLYARLSIPLLTDLTLTAGARHGRVSNDILVDTIDFGRSLPAGSEIDDTANAWEMGFSYQLNTGWRVFAKLDKNYRFVTADEYSAIADNNFFSTLFSFGTIVPFPVTQTGLSMEMGTEWRINEDYLSLQFYQLEIDDEIVFDPVQFLNTNVGDSRRKGMIIEGRYSLTEKLSISSNYSYLDAKYTSGKFENKYLTFLPRHTASINAAYSFNEKLTSYLEWQGVSDRQFSGDFTGNYPRLAGFSLINFNSAYQFERFRISLRVNNILDKHYSDSGVIAFDFRKSFPAPQVTTYYSSPGRNYMFTLQYNYH